MKADEVKGPRRDALLTPTFLLFLWEKNNILPNGVFRPADPHSTPDRNGRGKPLEAS